MKHLPQLFIECEAYNETSKKNKNWQPQYFEKRRKFVICKKEKCL